MIADSAQETAIQRALKQDGFAIFFEPRVGKTFTAIEVVNRRPDVQLLFITCPKGIKNVWEEAIGKHLKLRCAVELHHFEEFNSKKWRRKFRELCKKFTTMVIIDEIHKIKKRTNKQSKGLRTLVPHSRYRLGLTGTSIEKSIVDVWAIMDFIDPTIYGKYAQFRERYLIMGGFMGRKVIDFQNVDEFRTIMHAHSARIRLTDVADRPILTRRTMIRLPLGREAQRMYDELERRLYVKRRGVIVLARQYITLITRLQQLCGGFLCNKEQIVSVDTTKIDRCLIEVDKFSPCVIVCRYRHEMDAIQTRLGGSALMIRGGEPLLTASPKKDIVLIQTSAGLGIDLSHAQTIIFFSWDYSFINYEQMRFRILSRTQTTARYIFLMIENSIDEAIYLAAVRKK